MAENCVSVFFFAAFLFSPGSNKIIYIYIYTSYIYNICGERWNNDGGKMIEHYLRVYVRAAVASGHNTYNNNKKQEI